MMGREQNSVDNHSFGYRLLRIATDQYGVLPSELNEEQQQEAKAIAAREVLLENAVLGSREAAEVMLPQSQLKKAVEQIRERYESEEQFQDSLASNGLDEPALEKALARELKVDAVLSYVSSRVPVVEDTEVRLFYYMHKEKFSRPETRKARHILITINPDFPENTAHAAMQRLQDIAARLRKDSRRFEEQALKHSECPSSFNGGVLGDVTKGTLYPELEAVLFDMAEGTISDVVESPLGLHLLYCEKIQPEGPVPYEQIREKLCDTLSERQRTTFQRRWLREQVEAANSAETQRAKERLS